MKIMKTIFNIVKRATTEKNEVSGFTLIEMLIVLLVISVLILLFVPNIARHREHIQTEGEQAVLQLIDTQKQLFSMQNNGRMPTIDELVTAGFVTQEHAEVYRNQ